MLATRIFARTFARTPEGVLRLRLLSGLCLLSLGLPACYGHRTADEEVLIAQADISFDAGAGNGGQDGGASDCSKETDPIASLLCSLGGGASGPGGTGGIEDIITGLLGGGMTGQSCAKETDPIAQLLCTVTGTGGTGIEGLIGGLLGGGTGAGLGGLLGDAGVEGVVTAALAEVISGILDDLITSLLGGGNRDAGAGGLFGGLGGAARDGGRGGFFGGGNASLTAGDKSLDLTRSGEQCSAATPDDLLTRLVCARQSLDTLRTTLPVQ